MTRTVGQQQRTEFILDPSQALQRCRVLDAMRAPRMRIGGDGGVAIVSILRG